MQGIKLVTFDATNTFLRFKIPPWQYYSIVARDYGYTVTTEVLKDQMLSSFKIMQQKHPNFGKSDVTWKNWWKEIVNLTFQGQLPACANIDKIADKLIDDYTTTKCWTVAEGSHELLNLLKERNIALAVLSNFDPRLVDILRNINLYDRFDFVVTSYDVGYSKPDKRIFDSAINASKELLQPSQCLHIGDDIKKDYEGAQAAGWHAILIALASNKMVPASDHVFKSIQHLFDALKRNKVQL